MDRASERGHDPWVFRSVLDWESRILTLALRSDLWAAYDTENGSLFKVWRDGVKFDGPVYTTMHGPQPVSKGSAWLINPYRHPWFAVDGADTLAVEVRYRGHRFVSDGVELLIDLMLPEGDTVHVRERPEYRQHPNGGMGFERTWTTEGVPAGVTIGMRAHANGLIDGRSLEISGAVAEGSFDARKGWNGALLLPSNGVARATIWLAAEPAVANLDRDLAERALPYGLHLIERSDCRVCHHPDVATVGPAFQSIAERYRWTDYNVQVLTSSVIHGSSGKWGYAEMTPHSTLDPEEIGEMVNYILSLDGETPSLEPAEVKTTDVEKAEDAGFAVNVYQFRRLHSLPDLTSDDVPAYSGALSQLHLLRPADFLGFTGNFYLRATGMLQAPVSGEYAFRLESDDGSQLYVDGVLVVDNDAKNTVETADGRTFLDAGVHEIEVGYFQGRSRMHLSLQWAPPGSDKYEIVSSEIVTHNPSDIVETEPVDDPSRASVGIPGDRKPLGGVHPSFDLEQVRPDDFHPMVGGMDFLSDGRLVISTWDPAGSVYILSGIDGPPDRIEVHRIATGLAEPLGLKVVDDEIYVLQKQELTKLVDEDGNGEIDAYLTVANDWGVSPNFHEFAFGLAYRDGFFYATSGIALEAGGAAIEEQIATRGSVMKIDRRDGSVEFVASGLRTPNGIGFGYKSELFVADNQGDWLPSSKIVHVEPGAWFGCRSVDISGTEGRVATPPVVWLPHREIGRSPSTPVPLDTGVYRDQMLHGDVAHGGVQRVFVEEVEGQLQGAVFRFSQGLEAGVNRMLVGPDGAFYLGEIGNPGAWGQRGKLWYGLQRLRYNGRPTFEMLAVRALSDGLEIEFTQPLREGDGWDPAQYSVKQWWYLPTADYGGPKMDESDLSVTSVSVSHDRKRVFLEVEGIKEDHVVYLRLNEPFISASGLELWSPEAWYTMNRVPLGRSGMRTSAPFVLPGVNELSSIQAEEGWRLLFDGRTMQGWHGPGGADPTGWEVADGVLTAVSAESGADIYLDGSFENFELSLDWRIAEGAEAGILYLADQDRPLENRLEMQLIDTRMHPDGYVDTYRAGDLTGLLSAPYVATRPVGEWNRAVIKVLDGRVEHWLNGRLILDFELGTPQWDILVRESDLADVPGFLTQRRGLIGLEHGGAGLDVRNVRIRVL